MQKVDLLSWTAVRIQGAERSHPARPATPAPSPDLGRERRGSAQSIPQNTFKNSTSFARQSLLVRRPWRERAAP